MPAEQEMPIPMEQIEQIFRPREGDRLYWHQVKNALIMMSQNRDRFSEDLRYLCQGAFHEFRVDITANIASNPPRPLTAGQLDNLLTTLVNTANGIISPSAPAISWMLVPILLLWHEKRNVSMPGSRFGPDCFSALRKILGGDLLLQALMDFSSLYHENYAANITGAMCHIVWPNRGGRAPRTEEGDHRLSYFAPSTQDLYMKLFSKLMYIAVSYYDHKRAHPDVNVRRWALFDIDLVAARSTTPSFFSYFELALARFTPVTAQGGFGVLTHTSNLRTSCAVVQDNTFEGPWVNNVTIWDQFYHWYQHHPQTGMEPMFAGWYAPSPYQNFDINCGCCYDRSGVLINRPSLFSLEANEQINLVIGFDPSNPTVPTGPIPSVSGSNPQGVAPTDPSSAPPQQQAPPPPIPPTTAPEPQQNASAPDASGQSAQNQVPHPDQNQQPDLTQQSEPPAQQPPQAPSTTPPQPDAGAANSSGQQQGSVPLAAPAPQQAHQQQGQAPTSAPPQNTQPPAGAQTSNFSHAPSQMNPPQSVGPSVSGNHNAQPGATTGPVPQPANPQPPPPQHQGSAHLGTAPGSPVCPPPSGAPNHHPAGHHAGQHPSGSQTDSESESQFGPAASSPQPSPMPTGPPAQAPQPDVFSPSRPDYSRFMRPPSTVPDFRRPRNVVETPEQRAFRRAAREHYYRDGSSPDQDKTGRFFVPGSQSAAWMRKNVHRGAIPPADGNQGNSWDYSDRIFWIKSNPEYPIAVEILNELSALPRMDFASTYESCDPDYDIRTLTVAPDLLLLSLHGPFRKTIMLKMKSKTRNNLPIPQMFRMFLVLNFLSLHSSDVLIDPSGLKCLDLLGPLRPEEIYESAKATEILEIVKKLAPLDHS